MVQKNLRINQKIITTTESKHNAGENEECTLCVGGALVLLQ